MEQPGPLSQSLHVADSLQEDMAGLAAVEVLAGLATVEGLAGWLHLQMPPAPFAVTW